MSPSQSPDSLFPISLVILCLIFGILAIVFLVLYELEKAKRKRNAPWLYLSPSNKRQTPYHTNINIIASKIPAIGRATKLGIFDKFSLILLKKACSITGFTKKVINKERRNFPNFTRVILTIVKQCVNRGKAYNPLNKLVRRFKQMIKTSEFQIGFSMILIPLGFSLLVVASDHKGDLSGILWLLAGILGVLGGICFFVYTWKKVRSSEVKDNAKNEVKEEQERQDRENTRRLMQTLIDEVKGLRQDLNERDSPRRRGN